MALSKSSTLKNEPRRTRLEVSSANQRSTRFNQLELVHGELLNWAKNQVFFGFRCHARIRDVVILFVHLIVTVVRLARPGGLGVPSLPSRCSSNIKY
jgi:hypothetical protein